MKPNRTTLAAIFMLAAAITASAQIPSHLTNISTRGFVGTGEQVLIAGAIITGDTPKTIIVRALGPTLQQFGILNFLHDPVMDIYDANGTLIDSNDDWTHDALWWQVRAHGFEPQNSLESALYRENVMPGKYTVIVRGYADGVGIAIVEVYDVDP